MGQDLDTHCQECYPDPPKSWKDQEMNPELYAYVRAYISPVKQYLLTLTDAMASWGTVITEEDKLL